MDKAERDMLRYSFDNLRAGVDHLAMKIDQITKEKPEESMVGKWGFYWDDERESDSLILMKLEMIDEDGFVVSDCHWKHFDPIPDSLADQLIKIRDSAK